MKISSQIFPVGFILEVDSANFNPNSKYDGTWQRIKGKVIVGVDEDDTDFNLTGKTGGSKTSSIEQDGQRNSDTGSNWSYQGINTNERTFSIIQPYYCVYIWKLVSY